jgi:hypothetical protein
VRIKDEEVGGGGEKQKKPETEDGKEAEDQRSRHLPPDEQLRLLRPGSICFCFFVISIYKFEALADV